MGLEEFTDGQFLVDEKEEGGEEESSVLTNDRNSIDDEDKRERLLKFYSTTPDFTEDECEYEVEEKECARCMTIGHSTSRNTWKCPNDECSVVEFSMSYDEWHGTEGFL